VVRVALLRRIGIAADAGERGIDARVAGWAIEFGILSHRPERFGSGYAEHNGTLLESRAGRKKTDVGVDGDIGLVQSVTATRKQAIPRLQPGSFPRGANPTPYRASQKKKVAYETINPAWLFGVCRSAFNRVFLARTGSGRDSLQGRLRNRRLQSIQR
jgi:hypothetical protein